MIRKLLLATVALGTVSSAAFAADLPSRRAPPVFVPPPIPVFSWTGFYMGGQVGYAFGESRALLVGPNGQTLAFPTGTPNGIIGGAHAGYNFSTQSLALGPLGGAGGLIIGVEADVNGTDWRGSIPGGAVSIRKQIEGSVRGRVGVAVDRALFYATGGAAFTQFQTAYVSPAIAGGFAGRNTSRVGWTVGGGVEYAITTQWSLRAEYRYSDFGRFRDIVPVRGGAIDVFHRPIEQQVQVGFSYKFDAPVAPVVARY